MVKGISRQVIVVQSPAEELFDQAIFILKDSAVDQGITDEMLLKQAKQVIQFAGSKKRRRIWQNGFLWALVGSAITAAIWWFATLI